MKHDSQLKSKTMKKSWVIFYAFIATLSFFTLSCNDDDNNNDTNKPELASILPAEAHVGETVTLNGKNLNDGATDTKVSIGGTACKVAGGTETTISVEVPELEAGTYDVTATVSGETTKSVKLTVLEAQVDPMKFTGFSPTEGKYQQAITISGENFDKNVKVKINNVLQTDITYVNSTTIKVNLAKQTGSGKVVLMREGESDVESEAMLKYTFGYEVKEINSELGGNDIAVLDDGSYYLSSNFSLIKVNTDKTVDTIVEKETAIYPIGLFLTQSGILYFTDEGGRIFSYKEGEAIDTIISDDANIKDYGLRMITGDNKGTLYIAGNVESAVFKVNISDKSIKSIATTTDKDYPIGIALVGDTLYVTTSDGLFKVHKDGGVPNYIISKDSGYTFNLSDICIHPSGDLFIVDGNNGFYRLNAWYELTKELENTEVGMDVNKNGDIFIVSGSQTKKILVE